MLADGVEEEEEESFYNGPRGEERDCCTFNASPPSALLAETSLGRKRRPLPFLLSLRHARNIARQMLSGSWGKIWALDEDEIWGCVCVWGGLREKNDDALLLHFFFPEIRKGKDERIGEVAHFRRVFYMPKFHQSRNFHDKPSALQKGKAKSEVHDFCRLFFAPRYFLLLCAD